jgi:hypothetical protein
MINDLDDGEENALANQNAPSYFAADSLDGNNAKYRTVKISYALLANALSQFGAVADAIEALSSSTRLRGYYSAINPALLEHILLKKGYLWWQGSGSDMSNTFPVSNISEWDGGQWLPTSGYTVSQWDLWANLNDDAGYYWFGNHRNQYDAVADGVTLENYGGKIRIKDLGIGWDKLDAEIKDLIEDAVARSGDTMEGALHIQPSSDDDTPYQKQEIDGFNFARKYMGTPIYPDRVIPGTESAGQIVFIKSWTTLDRIELKIKHNFHIAGNIGTNQHSIDLFDENNVLIIGLGQYEFTDENDLYIDIEQTVSAAHIGDALELRVGSASAVLGAQASSDEALCDVYENRLLDLIDERASAQGAEYTLSQNLTAQAEAIEAAETAIDAAQTTANAALPKSDVIDDLVTGGSSKALSAEQGKTLAAMLSAAQQASTDRGTVLNALSSQGTHFSITGLTIATSGVGYAVGEAVGLSGIGALVDGIAVISAVDDAGAVVALTVERGGMFEEDETEIECYGGGGSGLILDAAMSEQPNTTLADIPNPQPNNTALVLQDENHAGLSYIWKFADYNGDEVFNWVSWAKHTGGGDSRDFETDPIQTSEIATGAVTNAKIADFAIGAAKLENAAVETAKVNDGAVTFSKIAAVPFQPIEADETDFSGTVSGEFGTIFISIIKKIKGLFSLMATTVKKTGPEMIQGTKTFSTSPVLPAADVFPTKPSNTKPATEKQVGHAVQGLAEQFNSVIVDLNTAISGKVTDFRFFGLSYTAEAIADIKMIPVNVAYATDSTGRIETAGYQFYRPEFKATWVNVEGEAVGSRYAPTYADGNTVWDLSSRPAGAVAMMIRNTSLGNLRMLSVPIQKSKADITAAVAETFPKTILVSYHSGGQSLGKLFACLMGIPEVAAAQVGTKFACSIFFLCL